MGRHVARRNPLGQIVSFAVRSALHPVATTGRTLAIGRMVVGQVARTAVTVHIRFVI